MRVPIRVVKVGGSLLDLVDLADRLKRWMAVQTAAHHVLVVGGGALVDQVRKWNTNIAIDNVAAHWMCIDLMTVTAHLLHSWLPEAALVEDDRLLLQRVGFRDCTIFGPSQWMRNSEPGLPGTKLPAGWEVTSDSIAARLAIGLNADELVLMKSALPADRVSLEIKSLMEAGYVDSMMERLEEEVPPVRLVNLRSEKPLERVLRLKR